MARKAAKRRSPPTPCRNTSPSSQSPSSSASSSSAPMLVDAPRHRNIESAADLDERGEYELASPPPYKPNRASRQSPTRGLDKAAARLDHAAASEKSGKGGMLTGKDRRSFALLVLLYLLQGVPLGLVFGTLPFLLKPKLSYSQLALFSLSTYPYSLKLLWSPIVDACFWPSIGRRKSWIIPVQAIIGSAMWWLGRNINGWLEEEVPNVGFLTFIFVSLIFFAATQDIAVDGWALTLLSHENLSYASTAQTVGLNSGYFLSFTVFLAFNSTEFGNKYFRSTPLDYPLISLGGYLQFWAVMYLAITVWLLRFQKEDPVSEDDPDMDVKKVYTTIFSIMKLKHVQSFVILHLLAKIGFMANDSITSLKLLEKGLLKEDMAVAVLIDFPFQMIGGWVAAMWSTGNRPLNPWISAFTFRLAAGLVSMALVAYFPSETPIPGYYFAFVVLSTVLASFTSTIQFVGISAFHTQIADPVIGGTYMTLLNTVSNLGGTWPKPFVLKSVDYFTRSSCRILKEGEAIILEASECVSEHGKHTCAALGGDCVTDRDGYYAVSWICVVIGAALLVGYIIPTARKLQALPVSAWKVDLGKR